MRNFTKYSHAAFFFCIPPLQPLLESGNSFTTFFSFLSLSLIFFFKTSLSSYVCQNNCSGHTALFFPGGSFCSETKVSSEKNAHKRKTLLEKPADSFLFCAMFCGFKCGRRAFWTRSIHPPRPPSVRSYNACSAPLLSTFSALESVGKLIFHR